MKLSMIAMAAILASCTLFLEDAAAQLIGRRRSYSTNTTNNQVHTTQYRAPSATEIVHAQPASYTVVADNIPTLAPTSSTVTTTVAAPNPAIQSSAAAEIHNSAADMMLDRNNQIRQSRGMVGMRLSDRLTNAAQHQANYMARTGSFSHNVNGSPQSRAAMYGFGGGVRENIAMGQNSVSSAFQDWTNSSGHYTNLMSNSNVAGFGYAVNSAGQGFWVAMYGNE